MKSDTRINIGKRGLYGLLMLPQNRPAYLMAKRLGVWPERLSEYSCGRRNIPDRVLVRMCDIMHVTPEEILCDYEPILLYDDPIAM